ncbi:unnamed protein product [Linum tenue]|uniref:Uncharacterized protein n=1 Tax=Linum tenue TaxID=586396 RepID=A0AAV0KP00_9ROSI|nr:unnamed protein product [Linum tenue]
MMGWWKGRHDGGNCRCAAEAQKWKLMLDSFLGMKERESKKNEQKSRGEIVYAESNHRRVD